MNKPSPYSYEINCPPTRIGDLYDCLSPIESLPPTISREQFISLLSSTTSVRYAVYIDGRLAGIAFITDHFSDPEPWRELAFTKTEYLTTSRRITFARTVPDLFADVNKYENKRLAHMTNIPPMFIHTPEDDERSKQWFINVGCSPSSHGLKCPSYTNRKEMSI